MIDQGLGMPYDYRKMTPEERLAAVAERRARGYPLHAPPHPFREAGWYFLTTAHFEHQPIMESAKRRSSFEDDLLGALHEIQAELGGWVMLPNHYHLLVGVDHLDQVSGVFKQVHGRTSRAWNLADGAVGR